MFSIEREYTCWQDACKNNTGCNPHSFYCDGDYSFSTLLNQSCPIQTPNTMLFNFGIFLDALQSGVVESKDFPEKFFYCFWWGLQNLRCAQIRCFSFIFLFSINCSVVIACFFLLDGLKFQLFLAKFLTPDYLQSISSMLI